jgi:predicted alpha/beta superfamily hydrolase
MRPLGPNIADRGSAYYHFNVAYFDSLDGERHYKVWTAIPNAAPPAQGYPILYALDGNAVMDRLSDSLLESLRKKRRPLLWPSAIKRICPLIRTPEPMTTGRKSRRILPTPDGTDGKAAAARHFASY